MFEALKSELRRELCAPRSQHIFDSLRPRVPPAVQEHPTIGALLTFLASRPIGVTPAQDELLRALVALIQNGLATWLWHAVLLQTFLPPLRWIGGSAPRQPQGQADLEGALCLMFLEVVTGYPLRRQGNIATGIILDTRKAYARHVRHQQQQEAVLRELATHAGDPAAADDWALGFAPADPLAHLDTDDLSEMWAALHNCEELTAEDVELLWGTEVCGMSIPQLVRNRDFCNETGEVMLRECNRLWRRRARARSRLYDFLKKMRGPCPVSAFSRLLT